jgi:hypothetical protein
MRIEIVLMESKWKWKLDVGTVATNGGSPVPVSVYVTPNMLARAAADAVKRAVLDEMVLPPTKR